MSLLFPAETCSFVRFSCIFRAVLKLEPLTFNPSVLGSNPRGPTTNLYIRHGSSRADPCLPVDEEPDECEGPTLFEYVGAPEAEASLLAQIVEVVEDGESAETDIAAALNVTSDAVRKAIARGHQKGDVMARRLYVARAKNPKSWGLRSV